MVPRLLATAVLFLALAGCGGYTLDGRVLRDEFTMLTFVDQGDQRLEGTPLPGVRVEVYRDPGRGNMALIASGVSDAQGYVSIPIDAFGAGWMEESWRIAATRPGYESADAIVRLPGGEKRLLIMMAPGVTPADPRDEKLMEQFERFR